MQYCNLTRQFTYVLMYELIILWCSLTFVQHNSIWKRLSKSDYTRTVFATLHSSSSPCRGCFFRVGLHQPKCGVRRSNPTTAHNKLVSLRPRRRRLSIGYMKPYVSSIFFPTSRNTFVLARSQYFCQIARSSGTCWIYHWYVFVDASDFSLTVYKEHVPVEIEYYKPMVINHIC